MMKRLIPILIFILISSISYSQTWRRVGGWGNQLTEVTWASDETGFIAGDQVILKTIDGGLSWTEQKAPSKNKMWGMAFFNENLGTIVGEGGAVFWTTDGGQNWQLTNAGTAETLRSVWFLTESRVYAVGDNGQVFRSSNGGQSWARQSVGTAAHLNSLYFVNQDTGYIATAQGQVIRTFNGGNNWNIQNTGQNNSLNGIHFTSGQTGFAVGQQGTIVKTTDAGSTWTLLNSGTERNLNTLSFNRTNPNIGVILGENATILRTVNAGTTIDGININNTQNYLSVSFRRASNMVFAVGEDGFVIFSNNSGGSWGVRLSGRDKDYTGTQFRTANLGYIIGVEGLVLSTSNGGNSLVDRSRPLSVTFNDLAFTTNAFGYIAGDEGILLRTTNSGGNWTSLTPGTTESINGLYFFNNTTGYIVGDNGFISRTVDSGVTWTAISLNSPNNTLIDLNFFDTSTGILIGNGGFMARTEDGENWQAVNSTTTENLKGIKILDEQTAVVIGNAGTILKSTDRGKTWVKINAGISQDLNALDFLDESVGFVTGQGGLIMVTRDGGDSWTPMPTGTFQDFTGISFGDLSSGFAVGEKGSLFNYSCQVPEEATVIFGENNICLSQQVYTVQNNEGPDVEFEWRVDGGTILEGQGTNRIEVRWDIPGRNAVLVRGKNNCGNGKTKGLEVLVSTQPQAITNIEGEGVGCLNNFMEYSVNEIPGTIFVWEVTGGLITAGQGTPNVTVQWTSLGQQQLKITPNNPCGQGTTYTKPIQVLTPPEKPSEITGPDTVGLTEEEYEVTNVANVNFQWTISGNAGKVISGQGTNKVRVQWEKEGDFILTVTPMNSCNSGSSSTLAVNINLITSINREISSEEIGVYPNPSFGMVTVSFKGINRVNAVKITDAMGNEIRHIVPSMGVDTIEFQGLPKGLYIVNIRSREREYNRKLLVR
ncbi:Por secretion system C-terminal sorting domain-containing protein [Aquiflexum balticum DSM 16537]|uniref:Por secretion system C-terminal sorting domain-containing protein n=1 Tax=Aquiflexum balticum DSM 16537 TaxID=758820 RepID=A0A1W2H061_9BACT|nr:YCF48-related protein [Aquiflexum balticum]SMD42325.1 Por secretion system C-terminal sorting domain-containing protein [Aquiflexum balticum DSM 16537]